YTYLPADICLLSLWKPVLYHCDCLHSEGSTRKILPTEAWCLSLSWPVSHIPGTCSSPTRRSPQAVTRRSLWAHRIPHPADEAEALLPVPARIRSPGSV